MASVLSLPTRPAERGGWTNQELAELYRAAENLTRAGLPIGAESGLSDEGHPWHVFYREDVQEVIVHFARIDGVFIAASAATDEVVDGTSFRDVIHQLLRRQPFILPMPVRDGGDLFLHPCVALTAFIATAYLMSSGENAQPAGDPKASGREGPVGEGEREAVERDDLAEPRQIPREEAAKLAEQNRAQGNQQEVGNAAGLELSAVQNAVIASALAVAVARASMPHEAAEEVVGEDAQQPVGEVPADTNEDVAGQPAPGAGREDLRPRDPRGARRNPAGAGSSDRCAE